MYFFLKKMVSLFVQQQCFGVTLEYSQQKALNAVTAGDMELGVVVFEKKNTKQINSGNLYQHYEI
jgi:hypothetical protein